MPKRGEAIREVLAAIGVIASLIFVALEIRQNTKAVQATAIQSLTDGLSDRVQLYASNPDVAGLLVRSNEVWEELSSQDQQRVFGLFVSGMLFYQGVFRQWQLGVLPDEEWSVVQAVVCQEMTQPMAQRLWPLVRETLVSAFVDVIEQPCGPK